MYEFLINKVAEYLGWNDLIQSSYVNKQWHYVLRDKDQKFNRATFAVYRFINQPQNVQQEEEKIFTTRILREDNETIASVDTFWNMEAFRDFALVEPHSYRADYRFYSFRYDNGEQNKNYLRFEHYHTFQILALSSNYLCVSEDIDPHHDHPENYLLRWVAYNDTNINHYTVHVCHALPQQRDQVSWITVDSYTGNFYVTLYEEPHALRVIDATTLRLQQTIRLESSLYPFTKFLVNSDPNVNLCYAWVNKSAFANHDGVRILTFQLTTGRLLQMIQVSSIYSWSLWTCHPHQPRLYLFDEPGQLSWIKYHRGARRGCNITHHQLPSSIQENISCSKHIHCYEETLYLTYSAFKKPYPILLTSIPCSVFD